MENCSIQSWGRLSDRISDTNFVKPHIKLVGEILNKKVKING